MSNKSLILGAIIGDVIGSVYEWNNIQTTDFPLFSPNCKFTDDSVLTFATMDAILNQSGYAKAYHSYGRDFPDRGYGGQQKRLTTQELGLRLCTITTQILVTMKIINQLDFLYAV